MDYEKKFMNEFKKLCGTWSSWQVWEGLITCIACSISNAVDWDKDRIDEREKLYKHYLQYCKDQTTLANLFTIIVEALEENPNQDFLGEIYMKLDLGSHWRGQFFTPYYVCEMMAKMNISCESVQEQVKNKGFISITDPACGAGATLIAATAILRKCQINHSTQSIFVGQDVDPIVGMMCYIQLSLLGCPGYICIANTLTNPVVGQSVIYPEQQQGQAFWFTPCYHIMVGNLLTNKKTA